MRLTGQGSCADTEYHDAREVFSIGDAGELLRQELQWMHAWMSAALVVLILALDSGTLDIMYAHLYLLN